ncbi:hypothetical protein Tco_0471567 [Tanacetum coccineum]
MVLRRKKKKSLDCNNSFLGKYECASLALDREDRRDEKKRLDHLKQDQIMLVIKRFSERKKIFRERKKTEKIRARSEEGLSFADSMARRSILVRVLGFLVFELKMQKVLSQQVEALTANMDYHVPKATQEGNVTPPNEVWKEYVSKGVTSSYASHKIK